MFDKRVVFEELNKFEVSKDYYNALNEVAEYVQAKKKELAYKMWEDLYKEKVGSKYLSLNEVIEKIRFENYFYLLEVNGVMEDLEEYLYSYNACISDLVSKCESLGLRLPNEVIDMICTCCVCGGCPSQNVCHYTCDTCKSEGYIHYSFECEE